MREELPGEPWRGVGDPKGVRRPQRGDNYAAVPRLIWRRFEGVDPPNRVATRRHLLHLSPYHPVHEGHPAAE